MYVCMYVCNLQIRIILIFFEIPWKIKINLMRIYAKPKKKTWGPMLHLGAMGEYIYTYSSLLKLKQKKTLSSFW